MPNIFTQNTFKMDLSVMKNTFSMEWCFRVKKIFSKIYCKLLLDANLTKLIVLLYLTQKVNFYSSKNIFKKF